MSSITIQEELSLSLNVSAVTVEENRLSFDRSLSGDELTRVLRFTVAASNSSSWWTGDTLKKIRDQKAGEAFQGIYNAAVARIKAEHSRDDISFNANSAHALAYQEATERCQAVGERAAREAATQFSDPAAAWDSLRVCEALPVRCKVSQRHHRAALDECSGDATEALKWVQSAEKGGWTVAELRQHIRRSGRLMSANEACAKSQKTITVEMRRINDRIKGVIDSRPVSSWTNSEVNAFLEDSELLRDVIEQVKQRFEEINPALSLD